MNDAYVDVDGAKLWTSTSGDGEPVVLLHGGPGGHDDLEPVASMVDDLVRVHRYEQRASGRSGGGPPFTIQRWIADLDALREHWGHDAWVVGGHSFGAALALAYAAEFPERTQALIYISCLAPGADQAAEDEFRANRSSRIPEHDRDRWLELRAMRESGSPDWNQTTADELVRIGFAAEFEDPILGHEYGARYGRTASNFDVNLELGENLRVHCRAPAFLDAVGRFDRPALLLHGEADLRPMWSVEWLADQLPDARLVRLPGGHVPWIEAPEELREALRSFIVSVL